MSPQNLTPLDNTNEPLPEVGYLGSAAQLTTGGMTFPNNPGGLLDRPADLKALLLAFDSLLLTGGQLTWNDGKPGMAPIAHRRAGTINGVELNWTASGSIDPVTAQLIETELLILADPRALLTQDDVNSLLLGLIDAVDDLPPFDEPLTIETAVPFDGGLLGPTMDDQNVHWLMEELQRLGLAIIESAPLLALSTDTGREEDPSSTVSLFLVRPAISDYFAALMSSLVGALGDRSGARISPLRSGAYLPREAWSVDLANPSPYLGLTLMHAQLLGLDLEDVPIDEILDFRVEHIGERRRFLRKMRDQVRILAHTDRKDRQVVLRDYYEEAAYLSETLTKAVRKSFRRGQRDLLLASAAVATTALANPVGATIGGLRAVAGLGQGTDVPDIFTYFYLARRNLTGR
jgi:hypothetical protein